MAASVRTRRVLPSQSIPVAQDFGPGALVSQQDIYHESSTQLHRIGERLQVGNRVFRYASAGENLYAGFLIAQPLVGGATTTLQTSSAVTVAASAGDNRVYVNAVTTAQGAGVFNDGYIAIFDATTSGLNWTYRIKTQPALATTGTTSYVDLYDPLAVAITTDEQCIMITNPYKSVILSDSTLASCPLGIAPISITNAYYFWLQTWGPVGAYAPEAALVFTEPVAQSDNADGGVGRWASHTTTPVIGYCLHTGTVDENVMIYLMIAP